jgi:hypothetical protein
VNARTRLEKLEETLAKIENAVDPVPAVEVLWQNPDGSWPERKTKAPRAVGILNFTGDTDLNELVDQRKEIAEDIAAERAHFERTTRTPVAQRVLTKPGASVVVSRDTQPSHLVDDDNC